MRIGPQVALWAHRLAAFLITRWAGHRKVLCPVVFLEREARAAHRGLWADKAPVAPWEWRASEKERKSEAAGTR